MSIACEMTQSFAEEVDQLVAHFGGGIDIADVLQRAATEVMKKCLGGDWDRRDQECFDMLETARRALVDEMPLARERMEQWRASVREDFGEHFGASRNATLSKETFI